MRRSRLPLLTAVLTVVAFIGTACGGTAPEVTAPTVTPISAAATTIPQTDTPVTLAATPAPPTDSPAPTTGTSRGATPTGSVLGSALEKAKSATSYRVEMQTTGKGALGLSGPETPPPGATPMPPANQEITMISMKGEVNGSNSHFELQGLFAAFLGVDPSKSLEVISVGDRSFIHGPAVLVGAPEDKWYELPSNEASLAKPPLTPASLLDSFNQTGVSASDFKKAGTENLDNRSCDVYSGDKSVIEKAFKDVGSATGGQDLSTVDSAEFKFWICDDGFLHQIRMTVEGHEKDKPEQKSSFLVQMHIYDIGADIKIEAPSGAELLKEPSFINVGTPTP